MANRSSLPQGSRLAAGPPPSQDHLTCGNAPGCHHRKDQAVAGLQVAWAAVHVVHEPSAFAVGIGRVLGDGGWYFHVLDMAALREHQRRSLGDAILSTLLKRSALMLPRART